MHRRSDECSVRASPRFPNVNLYSVKKEKREDCWREGDPGEKGGRRGVARQCSGIKSHKTRGKPPRASGTQKLIMDTMVDGSRLEGAGIHSIVPSKRSCPTGCLPLFLRSGARRDLFDVIVVAFYRGDLRGNWDNDLGQFGAFGFGTLILRGVRVGEVLGNFL